MAYNLQTLITILEQILEPQQKHRIHDDNKHQLKSILEKAMSLQQILEKYSLPNIENLEREIRETVHKAEDIIESCMVDRMRSTSLTEELLISFSSADLQQVTQQLDSAMEQVEKLVEEKAGKKIISSTSSTSSGGAASLNPKTASSIMVGFDKDMLELLDRLTGMQRKLEIIPIVGMGGAGKTTLARNLYEDPTIVSHFIARAWTTVSQDYNMRTILLSLLSCITGKEVVDGDVSLLTHSLYQSLYGRRYLIMLDDIWSTQVWDELRMFFPDNNNGSRVVITTRESIVATYANSQSWQHAIQLLSESASWKLLSQIVFGEDDCPCELESIGGKIASDCGGLPLAITAIGGLLSKVERSKDVWEDIGENVRGAIARLENNEKYSSILSLSYNHLPNYLKPCFLYMGGFPEDYEIKGSRLICYWIAEGFIKSNRDNKSLEEVAEEYLTGLVERNLLIVRRKKTNGKPKSYVIHDVLRDLCIRKADEDNFLHVMTDGSISMISKLRRVSRQEIRHSHEMRDTYAELISHARSLRWWSIFRDDDDGVLNIFSVSNLLRVLDITRIWLNEFPKAILQLVNLRYLGVNCDRLRVGISRLVNLQILIIHCWTLGGWSGFLPSGIWKMSGLRYLKYTAPYFTIDEYKFEMLVEMNKLQTIKCVELTEALLEGGFLQAIPNIKNLGIARPSRQVIDLSHLHKLETLTCKSFNHEDCRFPPTLRKLRVHQCSISPHVMTSLCGLPNLEVLKIMNCSFYTDTAVRTWEWEVRKGEEFRSLLFLQLYDLELVHWRADETNFPKLRHLDLRYCRRLKEIPSGIGEIPTLELIEMERCSASSVESAKRIVEEQHTEYANYALQLSINEW